MRCPTQGAIETAESQKGMVLKCHGSFIDTLQAKSDMIKFTVTTREKETQKKIPFLINHIWNKTVVEPRIPLVSAGELIASLTIVLTGGYLNESDSTSGGRIFLPAYHLKRKHLYRHWLPEALHIDSSRIWHGPLYVERCLERPKGTTLQFRPPDHERRRPLRCFTRRSISHGLAEMWQSFPACWPGITVWLYEWWSWKVMAEWNTASAGIRDHLERIRR